MNITQNFYSGFNHFVRSTGNVFLDSLDNTVEWFKGSLSSTDLEDDVFLQLFNKQPTERLNELETWVYRFLKFPNSNDFQNSAEFQRTLLEGLDKIGCRNAFAIIKATTANANFIAPRNHSDSSEVLSFLKSALNSLRLKYPTQVREYLRQPQFLDTFTFEHPHPIDFAFFKGLNHSQRVARIVPLVKMIGFGALSVGVGIGLYHLLKFNYSPNDHIPSNYTAKQSIINYSSTSVQNTMSQSSGEEIAQNVTQVVAESIKTLVSPILKNIVSPTLENAVEASSTSSWYDIHPVNILSSSVDAVLSIFKNISNIPLDKLMPAAILGGGVCLGIAGRLIYLSKRNLQQHNGQHGIPLEEMLQQIDEDLDSGSENENENEDYNNADPYSEDMNLGLLFNPIPKNFSPDLFSTAGTPQEKSDTVDILTKMLDGHIGENRIGEVVDFFKTHPQCITSFESLFQKSCFEWMIERPKCQMFLKDFFQKLTDLDNDSFKKMCMSDKNNRSFLQSALVCDCTDAYEKTLRERDKTIVWELIQKKNNSSGNNLLYYIFNFSNGTKRVSYIRDIVNSPAIQELCQPNVLGQTPLHLITDLQIDTSTPDAPSREDLYQEFFNLPPELLASMFIFDDPGVYGNLPTIKWIPLKILLKIIRYIPFLTKTRLLDSLVRINYFSGNYQQEGDRFFSEALMIFAHEVDQFTHSSETEFRDLSFGSMTTFLKDVDLLKFALAASHTNLEPALIKLKNFMTPEQWTILALCQNTMTPQQFLEDELKQDKARSIRKLLNLCHFANDDQQIGIIGVMHRVLDDLFSDIERLSGNLTNKEDHSVKDDTEECKLLRRQVSELESLIQILQQIFKNEMKKPSHLITKELNLKLKNIVAVHKMLKNTCECKIKEKSSEEEPEEFFDELTALLMENPVKLVGLGSTPAVLWIDQSQIQKTLNAQKDQGKCPKDGYIFHPLTNEAVLIPDVDQEMKEKIEDWKKSKINEGKEKDTSDKSGKEEMTSVNNNHVAKLPCPPPCPPHYFIQDS